MPIYRDQQSIVLGKVTYWFVFTFPIGVFMSAVSVQEFAAAIKEDYEASLLDIGQVPVDLTNTLHNDIRSNAARCFRTIDLFVAEVVAKGDIKPRKDHKWGELYNSFILRTEG